MAFDTATLSKARESGYSDEEVSQFVVQSDPRVKTALDSGYTLDEVASFFDQKEKPTEQTYGDKSSRFLAAASSQGINALAGATRLGQFLQPQWSALFDEVAKSTGLATIGETITEMEGASERAKDDYGVDPKQDNSLLSSVATGAGSLLPTLATGPFAPAVNALSMGESGFQEAEQEGASELQKMGAFAGNAATGYVTEKLLGVPALLKAAQKAKLPEQALGGLIKSVVKQAGLSFAREGTQETLEQVSSDLIAKYISAYDPDRNVFDLEKLGKTFLVGGIVGAPVGGLVQAAVSLETPPKEAMQADAEKIDASLAKIATLTPEEMSMVPPGTPEDLVTLTQDAVQEQQTAEVYGNVPEQPGEVQAPVPAEEGAGGVPPSPAERSETAKIALLSPSEFDAWHQQRSEEAGTGSAINIEGLHGTGARAVLTRGARGFIKDALEAGQPVNAELYERANSERAIPLPEGYTKQGDTYVKGEAQAEFVGTSINTPQGPITGQEIGSSHNTMTQEALAKGTPWETLGESSDPDAPPSALGFAFKKPDGSIEWVDRVEGGRRLTQMGLLKGLKEGEPVTSEHIRNKVAGVTFTPTPQITEDQAAETLQPFFEKAVAAARAAGATDPETAASQAQIELSQQVAQGKTKLDNPEALFSQAATLKARNQLTASQAQKRGGGVAPESLETSGAATTQGPRSELLSQEDEQQITGAIDSLPDAQKKVMGALVSNPDATDKEIAAQTGLSEDQVNRAKKAARNTLKQFIIDQGLGRSLGPGAASVDEVLAVYEERKFGKRLQDSELEPEIKKDIGDRYYEVIPNRVTAKRATELIEENGEESIEEQIRDEKSTISYADRVTVGEILIKRYNQQFKNLKQSNPEEARKALDKSVSLAEWGQDFGTRLGQGIQAFAMWSRLTPEGKLRTFKKLVDKKRKEFTRNNRTDIDEIKDITNSDVPKAEKVRKLKSLKSQVGKKIKSRAERLIDASKDGLTDEKFFTATSDVLELPVFSPEVSAEIMRLALLVDQAPEGMPKMEATLNLNRFIAEQKGFDPGDLPLGIYYGNILSGVNTQAINLVDTSLNVLNEVSTLAIQNPKAALEIMSGMLRGFATGRFDAATAILQGRRISDGKFVEDPFFMEIARFGEKGGVPIKTGTRTGRALKTLAESKAATFLRGYKYVGRLMSASDALAFRGAQEAKSAQLAWQIAQDPEAPSVSEILGYDRIPEYLKQAQSEGYTGSQMQARATELMLMSRPEAIQKASTDFASEATYNVKPYGFMGIVSNTIEGLTRKVPALKIVVPFTRIVGNVVNRGLNNSPWGYVRAIRGKAGTAKDPRTFKEYSPEERNALLIRATIGTTAIVTATVLHQLGYLTIHGAGPSDPDKKKQLRQTGWKPYTIQIGDKYFSYTYTPFGLAMAATGNFLDNEKYQDFSSKEGLDRFTYAFQSIASTIFNQSFLSGLSTFFDIIAGKSPAQQITSFRRFAANTVSSFAVPFSSALKDLEAIATDPNIPKVDNLRQAIVANIPFASQALKPQLNALGEPIKASRNRLFSEQGNDPVWKLVADKQLRIPVPNQFFDDPEGQYEYVQKQGKLLRTWLEANLSSLRNMDTDNAQDAIERASDSFRQRTRNELLNRGIRKKEKK